MKDFIIPLIVGIICVTIGISNMKGNISTLHSYHRNRVSEEDRIPFGKKVGLGTVIIGVSIIIQSVLSAITVHTSNQLYFKAGMAVLAVGIVAGVAISLWAIKKYNKAIF